MSANTILNARNIPLNMQQSTVPNMSGALTDWFQPMEFVRVRKIVKNFQLVEVNERIPFRGVIQPLHARDLILKPEGQRAWTWFMLHAQTSLILSVDEIVHYDCVPTRVMARNNYALYGYVSYELVQDYDKCGGQP